MKILNEVIKSMQMLKTDTHTTYKMFKDEIDKNTFEKFIKEYIMGRMIDIVNSDFEETQNMLRNFYDEEKLSSLQKRILNAFGEYYEDASS